MKISFNELQSLSWKAFIGLGFSDGQASDAADMLCWMESFGLEGVKTLKDALEQYSLEHPYSARYFIQRHGCHCTGCS